MSHDEDVTAVSDRSLIPDPYRSVRVIAEHNEGLAVTEDALEHAEQLEMGRDDLSVAADDLAQLADQLSIAANTEQSGDQPRLPGARLVERADALIRLAVECRVAAQRIADADAADCGAARDEVSR